MPLIRHCLAANNDCGRRLAGDAGDAVCQEHRVIVHRRQAASRKNVFIQQMTCFLTRAGQAATPAESAHRHLIATVVLGNVQALVRIQNQLATVPADFGRDCGHADADGEV